MERDTKLISVFVAVISAVALGAVGFNTVVSQTAYVIIDFDESRAFQDEAVLCGFGPRLTGTLGEVQGAEYIRSQFTDAGLSNVEIIEYPEILYEVEKADVSIVKYGLFGMAPDPRGSTTGFVDKVDFVVQSYSGSRGWSDFTDDLEIVDAGLGFNDSDFANAQGKAAIVGTSGQPPANSELFFRAWQQGAAAVIIHNTYMGEVLGYLPIGKQTQLPEMWPDNSYPDIPIFMVSKDMGDILQNSKTSHRLRLDFDITIEKRAIHVVVGDLVGTERPNDIVMLGAHHDTHYVSQGAIDNTVGVVTVIEMARQLVKFGPQKATIRFVTWGGEELGLLGSLAYVDLNLEKLQGHLRMYMNVDMAHVHVGKEHGVWMGVNSNDVAQDFRDIWTMVREEHSNMRDYRLDVAFWDGMGGSDQLGFAQEGFTVSSAFGHSDEYHTHLDTIDTFNAESLGITTMVYGSYALHLASQ